MGQEQPTKRKKPRKPKYDTDEENDDYYVKGNVMIFKENKFYDLCPLEEDLWNAEYEVK